MKSLARVVPEKGPVVLSPQPARGHAGHFSVEVKTQ